MKTLIFRISIVLILAAVTSCRPVIYTTASQPQETVVVKETAPHTYQVFYDDLSPYGVWVDYPEYGYVWVPRIHGFIPYCTGGRWIYTEYGWTWFSTYSWGWAPFHYGRWFFDDIYGWLWVPGNEWAPAWVVWGFYNNYYGWAPVGPGHHHHEHGYMPPHHNWHFVHSNQINQTNINNYIVNNTTVINNNTTNITVINNYNTYNNTTYNSGPKKEEVEKFTKKVIEPVRLKDSKQPVTQSEIKAFEKDNPQNKELPVYRPDISDKNAEPAQIKGSEIKKSQNFPEEKKFIKPDSRNAGEQNIQKTEIKEGSQKQIRGSEIKSAPGEIKSEKSMPGNVRENKIQKQEIKEAKEKQEVIDKKPAPKKVEKLQNLKPARKTTDMKLDRNKINKDKQTAPAKKTDRDIH